MGLVQQRHIPGEDTGHAARDTRTGPGGWLSLDDSSTIWLTVHFQCAHWTAVSLYHHGRTMTYKSYEDLWRNSKAGILVGQGEVSLQVGLVVISVRVIFKDVVMKEVVT